MIYFVDLCTYIIPDVYNNVQTREIQNFIQGNSAFDVVACHYHFEREANVTTRNMTKSLEHCLVLFAPMIPRYICLLFCY